MIPIAHMHCGYSDEVFPQQRCSTTILWTKEGTAYQEMIQHTLHKPDILPPCLPGFPCFTLSLSFLILSSLILIINKILLSGRDDSYAFIGMSLNVYISVPGKYISLSLRQQQNSSITKLILSWSHPQLIVIASPPCRPFTAYLKSVCVRAGLSLPGYV